MQLLGVRIDNVTMLDVLQKIEAYLADGKQHYIVTVNPEFIVRAQSDEEFREILNAADLVVPDGIGVIWAARFLGEQLKERVTGVDLIEKIKNQSRSGGTKFKIFLLGGKDGVADNLAADWPGVVGFCEEADGIEPFVRTPIDAGQSCPELITGRIGKHQPDILLVALGAPKQEKWISQNLAKLPSVKVAIGVGGALDLTSGRLRRAPRILQQLGLEWLWRLALEPRRLPRIFNAVIVFPFLVLKSWLHL